ncbi:hypothetical protein D3C78_1901540 [compost metagenome]
MPSACSSWLTTPLRPSSTTQAKVRTRKLVQNDSSTQNSSDVLRLADRLEIR